MLNFLDFEVTKYNWLVVVINPIERTKKVIWDNPEELTKLYEEHKNEIWIGYNSRNYDQYIYKGIMWNFDPKEINDWIIVDKKKGWQFSSLFRNIPFYNFDIMTTMQSLKQLEGFMGNDIRETTVPFDIDRPLTDKEKAEMEFYCTHDVEQTIEVFLQRKVEFDSHMALIKMFGLNISNISKSQAQLASVILDAKRVDNNDEWDIRLPDTLQLTKYKHIADWFLSEESQDTKAKLVADVCGVKHIFAWGGIHGALEKFHYECKPDELMVMADVSQLYPYLMLVYKLLSRGCPKSAYDTLKHTIDTSIRLKEEGKKAEREPYKRFNNIIYGAMGDKTNQMYDPLHRNLVCVFGQVLILDLLEKLEPHIRLIQSNTDGVFFIIKASDFDLIDDIVYEWEQRTGLTMTFDIYKTVYQGDVNNYVVIDYDGKMKSKGAYVKSLNPLDYDLPIVNKAMIEFIVNGISPEITIDKCDDLIEYQKIVKVSSKYLCGWHNGERLTDKTFRVFASKRSTDSYIGKQKTEGATIEKFANTPERCFIDNSDVKDKRVPNHLDKSWYVDLAKTRLKEKFNLDC